MAVNDDIMDLEIRHQVGVQRLGSGVLQKLIPLLDRADAEIAQKLLEREGALSGRFTTRRSRSSGDWQTNLLRT